MQLGHYGFGSEALGVIQLPIMTFVDKIVANGATHLIIVGFNARHSAGLSVRVRVTVIFTP
jgi:hypothetical protein